MADARRAAKFFYQKKAEGAQRQKELDALKHKRALETQELKNKGRLNVADRNQIGATKRTGMTEAGQMNRHKDNFGLKRDRFGWAQKADQRDFGLKERIHDENFWLKKDALDEDRRQFDTSHELNRNKFGWQKEYQGGMLDQSREKSRLDRFKVFSGAGGEFLRTPAERGDLVAGYEAFEKVGPNQIQNAIGYKIAMAKANGIPLTKVNFTDAERQFIFDSKPGKKIEQYDKVVRENGQVQHFDQSGNEVEFYSKGKSPLGSMRRVAQNPQPPSRERLFSRLGGKNIPFEQSIAGRTKGLYKENSDNWRKIKPTAKPLIGSRY